MSKSENNFGISFEEWFLNVSKLEKNWSKFKFARTEKGVLILSLVFLKKNFNDFLKITEHKKL